MTTYDETKQLAEQMIRDAWDAAVDAAHVAGYEDGRQVGQAAGWEDGHATGFARGRESGLTEGEAVGYTKGHEDGLVNGHALGYAEGYAAAKAKAEAEAPDPVEPPLTPVKLGFYRGNPHEQPLVRHEDKTGTLPDFVSVYVQAWGRSGGTLNVPAIRAYLEQGVDVLITVSMIGSPFTHEDVANGHPEALRQIDHFVAALNELAGLPGTIYFTWDHENEVKQKAGDFPWNPTIEHYVGGFNRWRKAIKERVTRPVEFVYWYGYYREDWIAQVLAGIDRPDAIMLDPYVFSDHPSTNTLEDMAMPKVEWLRAQDGYDGQPIFFAEYAKDTSHGDEEVAAFLTDLRPRFRAMGVAGACYFARNKSKTTSNKAIQADIFVDGAPFPLALAAYTASMNQERTA